MYAERIVFVGVVVCHTCKCPFCIRKCVETLFNWLNSIDVSWEFGICWQVIDWLVLNNFLVYSKCAMRIYLFGELYWRSDYYQTWHCRLKVFYTQNLRRNEKQENFNFNWINNYFNFRIVCGVFQSLLLLIRCAFHTLCSLHHHYGIDIIEHLMRL